MAGTPEAKPYWKAKPGGRHTTVKRVGEQLVQRERNG
jgi:hypothetical protein